MLEIIQKLFNIGIGLKIIKRRIQKIVVVMENINNTLCEALGRYYKVLEKTGYVKQGSVNQLLLLIFIQEILDNYSEFITE